MPPIPKELTPALRGVPLVFHSERVALTYKGLLTKSIRGLGSSKCRVGGSNLCLRAKTVLISPATPAAASK